MSSQQDWFRQVMDEPSKTYLRHTAWQEAEFISAVADIQGCLKFGVISPQTAALKLAALKEVFSEVVPIVANESPWLENFEASLRASVASEVLDVRAAMAAESEAGEPLCG